MLITQRYLIFFFLFVSPPKCAVKMLNAYESHLMQGPIENCLKKIANGTVWGKPKTKSLISDRNSLPIKLCPNQSLNSPRTVKKKRHETS